MKHLVIAAAIALAFGQAKATSLPQSQGQAQGQAQAAIGVGVGIAGVSSRISNETRLSASQLVSTGVTINEAPIPAVTTQNIRQSDYTVKNVPNVLTGSVYPTAPCMGSSQVGAAGIGFGVSVGTSWTDDECGIRETARSFSGMNLPADALAILCTSKYAAAAPSCKTKE